MEELAILKHLKSVDILCSFVTTQSHLTTLTSLTQSGRRGVVRRKAGLDGY